MSLLYQIERHLRRTGTSATRFGRDALRDPRFVLDLRCGRNPGAKTEARVRNYLASVEGVQSACGR